MPGAAIGGAAGLWDSLLQDYLNHLFRQLPGIALRAVAQDRAALIRQLLSHTLDIALMYDPPKVDELRVKKITSQALLLVTTYRNITLSEVFSRSYIDVDWGTSFNIQQRQYDRQNNPPVMHTSAGRIALDFMLENGGSAFLPATQVQTYLDDKRLFALPDAPPLHRDVYAAYLKSSEKQAQLEEIVSFFSGINQARSPCEGAGLAPGTWGL